MPFDPQIPPFDVVELARRLIGAEIRVRGASGIIIETEAYARDDPASHSFVGLTRRNATMFGPAGHAYVYRSYGIHLCLNVTAGDGAAVLLRALQPVTGLDGMARRRRGGPLCSGPGRLAEALDIRPEDDGRAFGDPDFLLTLPATEAPLLIGPRIGISRATDRPWRFGLAGVSGYSRPFPPPMSPGR